MISQKEICGYCVETNNGGQAPIILDGFRIIPAVFVYTLAEKYFKAGLVCPDKWKSNLEFADKLNAATRKNREWWETIICGVGKILPILPTYGNIERWARHDWPGFCRAFEVLKEDSPELVRAAIPYMIHNENTEGKEFCLWYEAERWNAEKGKPEYYGGGLIDVGPLENPEEFRAWLDGQDLVKWLLGEGFEREKPNLKICKLLKLAEIDDACKVGWRKIDGLNAAAPSLGLLPSLAVAMVQERTISKRKRTKITRELLFAVGAYILENDGITIKEVVEHFNISRGALRRGTKLREIFDRQKTQPKKVMDSRILGELGINVCKRM